MKYSTFLLAIILAATLKAQDSPAIKSANRYIRFEPTIFYNSFSLNNQPVLKIFPGDTVSTETVDAAGYDKTGNRRARGGNPLTGPFFIEGATTGDVLAITFTKVSLNRPSAFTSESLGSRSLPKSTLDQLPKMRIVHWQLDLNKGIAIPKDSNYRNLTNFNVPLAPFVGCVGLAPDNRKNEILSFFQGSFGGNLDYKSIRQGATIYLPVFHEGAYLYVGDGHAVQGDGEIAGNALETSLDIDFTVKLISKGTIDVQFPRIEDKDYIMSTGIDKSMETALKIATDGLLKWILSDYKLTLAEATQVLSTTIQYDIAEIADPEIVIVAKIKKQYLKLSPK